jgi:hypothetical protein
LKLRFAPRQFTKSPEDILQTWHIREPATNYAGLPLDCDRKLAISITASSEQSAEEPKKDVNMKVK